MPTNGVPGERVNAEHKRMKDAEKASRGSVADEILKGTPGDRPSLGKPFHANVRLTSSPARGPYDTKQQGLERALQRFREGTHDFCFLVSREIHRERTKFPRPQIGLHEGYAVLLEEVDEFWDEVKAQKPDKAKVLAELVQIAAMAQRCAEDVLRGS